MSGLLVSVAASRRRTSLRRFTGSPQRPVRLVAFPWCGAGASVYRRLTPSLPDHIDLLSVQLPGREDRYGERRLLCMEEIVETVIDDILAVFDRPLVLFGHSMGALVAYEIALAIRNRTGREPAALIVSGRGAPHGAEPSDRCWHTADEDAFMANIRALGGTPDALLDAPPMMRAFIPMLRADYEVVETYKPRARPRLSCPLLACAGDQDEEVSPETMSAWLPYTTGPQALHWFIGGHFYLCSQPEALTRRLMEWITPGTRAAGRRRELNG